MAWLEFLMMAAIIARHATAHRGARGGASDDPQWRFGNDGG
jgi:hypothetical protein